MEEKGILLYYHEEKKQVECKMNIKIKSSKKRTFGIIAFSLFFILLSLNLESYTPTIDFRVMTYNALNFSHDDGDRAGYFKTVFDSVNADVILMQEMINEAGCDTLLNRLNTSGNEYARANFIDGYDSDNMLFYRISKCSLISQETLQTDLRDISEYVLLIGYDTIRFYSCHLKSSQGSSNEQRRLEEATILRNYLNDSIPVDAEFIIAGDMNFYYDEQAYYKLTGDEVNNNGRSEDPLNQPGNWHDNPIYASIHTQSTRAIQFGGGASGGLDDRFDFIFTNHGINDDMRVEYILWSYISYGNDGNHLNESINDGTNDSVSTYMANALFYASDHLPVYADFVSSGSMGVNEEDYSMEPSISVNLINSERIEIKYTLNSSSKVLINIYNLLGQRVKSFYKYEEKGKHTVIWEECGTELSSGIYLLKFRAGKYKAVKKLFLIK